LRRFQPTDLYPYDCTRMTIATAVEPQSPQCPAEDLFADHVACQLRSSRLTVLYGGAASSVSSFIAGSVVPQLGRRRWDHHLTRARQDVPTSTRQGRWTSRRQSGASAELVVVVDRWTGPAIETLQKRINDAFESAGAYMTAISLPIADSLSAWSQLLDLRFLIMFDRFQEFLAGREDFDDGHRFTRELVQALGKPDLAVNVLFCAAASSEPQMQRYQMQFGELEEASCVRLPLHRSSGPPSQSDLTLIEWREGGSARERAAHSANPAAFGDRPVRARGELRAACAAMMTAIAVFCWPVLQPRLHVDATGYVAETVRALQHGVSELVHRIDDRPAQSSACRDDRPACGGASSSSR
jgi:hypothetical protein